MDFVTAMHDTLAEREERNGSGCYLSTVSAAVHCKVHLPFTFFSPVCKELYLQPERNCPTQRPPFEFEVGIHPAMCVYHGMSSADPDTRTLDHTVFNPEATLLIPLC